MKSLFRSIIFSSLFFGLSAQANQLCEQGYTDGGSDLIRENRYITYNGIRHDCVENEGFDRGSYRYDCGNGLRMSSTDMSAYIPSKEGIMYEFFGNDSGRNPNDFNRIDCSSGSHCLQRVLENNLARPREPQINFNVLISTYRVYKIECNKLSF